LMDGYKNKPYIVLGSFKLGWMPQGLTKLIGKCGLMLWPLIKKEDEFDNFDTICMLWSNLAIVF
jgi:hypothetical protein